MKTRNVWECGSPLPLSERHAPSESAKGLAQSKTWRSIIALSVLVALTIPAAAATRTWNGFDSGDWSDPDNWTPNGVPQNGDALVFPNIDPVGEYSLNNNLTNLTVDTITFTSGGYSLSGNVIVFIQGITDNSASGVNRIHCPIEFTSGGGRFNTLNTGQLEFTGTVTLRNNQDLIITASISDITVSRDIIGSGGLIKRGDGTLFLRGSVANSYTGPTRIEAGHVHLAKTSGAQAISALVAIVGDGPTAFDPVFLADDLPGQYPPQLSMVITNGGVWHITNGATVTNLVLIDSDLGGSGLLNLECDVIAKGFCAISCSLNLGNQSRTFFVDRATGRMETSGNIVGPLGPNSSGIIKQGAGSLFLETQNTYVGPTVVRDGRLIVTHSQALGASGAGAETRVEHFGELSFGDLFSPPLTIAESFVLLGERISFVGTNTLTGPLVLSNDCFMTGFDESALFEISGVISGPNSFSVRGGTVRLSGQSPNTFGTVTSNVLVEPTTFNNMRFAALELAKPNNVVAVPVPVTLEGTDTNLAVLRNLQNDGVTDVRIYHGGSWLLNGYGVGATALTFFGDGIVDTGAAGTLFLHTNELRVVAGTSNYTAQIFGNLACPQPTNDFVVEAGTTLDIFASIFSDSTLRKLGGGTLRLLGNNTFTGPFIVEAGDLFAGSTTALGSVGAGTFVRDGATLSLGTGAAFLGEPLTLSGSGSRETNGALFSTFDILVTNNVVLTGPTTIRTEGASSRIQIQGVISGTGPLTKVGAGVFGFLGNTDNTYSGDTFVNEGTMRFAKANGIASVPRHLIIGGGVAEHGASFTIVGSVTVNGGGLWNVNGFAEGFSVPALEGRPPLTLNDGGDVQTGSGIIFLPVGGDVVVDPGLFIAASSTISGSVGLDPGPHRFVIGSGVVGFGAAPPLTVSAIISQTSTAADLVKEGPGAMLLTRSNSFTGTTTIESGTLIVSNNFALGTIAGGTFVTGNGSLALHGAPTIVNEALTLNSSNVAALQAPGGASFWSGPVQLARDAGISVGGPPGSLTFSTAISGAGGLTKLGGGTLILAGSTANSYSGDTIISNGVVEVNKPVNVLGIGGDAIIGDPVNPPTNATLRTFDVGHMRRTANVTVNRSGLLEVGGSGLAIQRMPGAGRVNIAGGSTLTISNDISFELAAVVSGTGTLQKRRSLTSVHVTSDSPFSGPVTVFDGFWRIDGNWANSPATVKTNAELHGDGVIGNLTVESDAVIRPDSAVPGRLGAELGTSSANFLTGGILSLALYGPHPTGGNDSLLVNGPVTLNNTRLSSSFKYPPREGDVAFLIRKTTPGAVSGTFSGYPQGALRMLGDTPVVFNYSAGDGNDVILTVTNLALAYAGSRLAEGNGNQTVEPNECNLLFISLTNRRATTLTITSAVLRATSGDALVTIASAVYPSIPAGAVRENLTPFQFRTTPDLQCGTEVEFELVVGVSNEGTFAIPLSLETDPDMDCPPSTGPCESCFVVTGQFTTNAPTTPRPPQFVGFPSICFPPKPCPQTNFYADEIAFAYVSHPFTNATTNELCVTAQFWMDCPNPLGVVAYLGTNDIHDPCLNYLGDGLQRPWAFFLPSARRLELRDQRRRADYQHDLRHTHAGSLWSALPAT